MRRPDGLRATLPRKKPRAQPVLPNVVADHSNAVVTATGNITHRCPHVDEIDRGKVTITWRVQGETYELHSLADYLAGFADARLSHEQITDRIAHDLSIQPGIELIHVGSEWATAGLEVTCSTSPTRAVTP